MPVEEINTHTYRIINDLEMKIKVTGLCCVFVVYEASDCIVPLMLNILKVIVKASDWRASGETQI